MRDVVMILLVVAMLLLAGTAVLAATVTFVAVQVLRRLAAWGRPAVSRVRLHAQAATGSEPAQLRLQVATAMAALDRVAGDAAAAGMPMGDVPLLHRRLSAAAESVD